jgi:hypothetical protein
MEKIKIALKKFKNTHQKKQKFTDFFSPPKNEKKPQTYIGAGKKSGFGVGVGMTPKPSIDTGYRIFFRCRKYSKMYFSIFECSPKLGFSETSFNFTTKTLFGEKIDIKVAKKYAF